MSELASVKTETAQDVKGDGHITLDAFLRYPTNDRVKCELGTATVGDAMDYFRPTIKQCMGRPNV